MRALNGGADIPHRLKATDLRRLRIPPGALKSLTKAPRVDFASWLPRGYPSKRSWTWGTRVL